jgi:hypothetical protein
MALEKRFERIDIVGSDAPDQLPVRQLVERKWRSILVLAQQSISSSGPRERAPLTAQYRVITRRVH